MLSNKIIFISSHISSPISLAKRFKSYSFTKYASYRLLKINQNSSQEEIKTAFLKFSMIYHPDNIATGDNEKFLKIKAAYDNLKEKNKVDDSDEHDNIMQDLNTTNENNKTSSNNIHKHEDAAFLFVSEGSMTHEEYLKKLKKANLLCGDDTIDYEEMKREKNPRFYRDDPKY